MMKFLIVIALMPFFQLKTYSQTKRFSWKSNACSFHGIYNCNKYSEIEIKNTYKLGISDYFAIQNRALVFELSDLKKLNLQSLKNEYLFKSRQLRNLKIVNTSYWKKFKADKIVELDNIYKAELYDYFGYLSPDSLRNIKLGSDCNKSYLPALISGGSNLLILWQKINEQQIKKGLLSKDFIEKYKQQYISKDKYQYARIAVMNIWWNCTNAHMSYVNNINNNLNFKKLFLSVSPYDCDDAD